MNEAERFARWARAPEGSEPAPIVAAATVILLRDAPTGLETLMLRRDSRLAFAGGMWVFPGGRVDPADFPADRDLRRKISPPPVATAAVREAAEEAGLVVDPDSLVPLRPLDPAAGGAEALLDPVLRRPGPEGRVTIDDGEIRDHMWVSPAEALRAPGRARDRARTTDVGDAAHAGRARDRRRRDRRRAGQRARALHHQGRVHRRGRRGALARRCRLRGRRRRRRRVRGTDSGWLTPDGATNGPIHRRGGADPALTPPDEPLRGLRRPGRSEGTSRRRSRTFCPVTYDASGDARKTTTFATSSRSADPAERCDRFDPGAQSRRRRAPARSGSSRRSRARRSSPGCSARTRTPRPSSARSRRPSPRSTDPRSESGRTPLTDAWFTMLPPCSRISGTAARIPWNVPVRFTSTSLAHAESEYLCSGIAAPTPALLNSTVSPPSAAAASLIAARARFRVADVRDEAPRSRARRRSPSVPSPSTSMIATDAPSSTMRSGGRPSDARSHRRSRSPVGRRASPWRHPGPDREAPQPRCDLSLAMRGGPSASPHPSQRVTPAGVGATSCRRAPRP